MRMRKGAAIADLIEQAQSQSGKVSKETAVLADELLALAEKARKAGRPRDAREFLSSAIEVLRQADAPVALAKALRASGEVARQLADSDGGVAAYEEAVDLARRAQEPLFFAHTARHLGDLYRHRADFGKAAVCYRDALDVYRNNAEARPLDVANAFRAMALLHEQSGSPDEARAHWQEAKRFYDTAGVDAGSAESAERIALLSMR